MPPPTKPQKLLFICSVNRVRSLTAERMMAGIPGYEVRSAGTQPGARVAVTAGHLGWADIIFVMEPGHRRRLEEKFPDALAGKQVVCLHVTEYYEYMDPQLVDELRGKLAPYVKVPQI